MTVLRPRTPGGPGRSSDLAAEKLTALLRKVPNATPALQDLNGLLAILHPLPLRRPPGDPEQLALIEGERARSASASRGHVRFRPPEGGEGAA